MMALGDGTFIILYVDDMERATGFYRDVLGLPLVYSAPGWVQFGSKGVTVVLHPKVKEKKESTADRNTAHIAFQVQDLQADYDRLRGQVRFKTPPSVAEFGKHATFNDPDGNEIDLIEWRRMPQLTVTEDTVVNDIIAQHPETMEVFESHGIRICGGCLVLLNAPLYETAEYSGLDRSESSALVGELNQKLGELEPEHSVAAH